MSNAERQKMRERLLDSHWAYQGKIIKLRLDTYQIDAKTKVFELVSHPGAVVIIPVDPKGNLLLVSQWRRACQKTLLELPAGTLEEGEDPLFCAQRELQEETGHRGQKWTSLKGFYSAPGFCDEYLHLFVAEDLLPSQLAPDEDEGIDVVPIRLDQAVHAIEEGKIVDAKSIASILRYQIWSQKKQ
jgi:ADP-ribose pyrophosphatase